MFVYRLYTIPFLVVLSGCGTDPLTRPGMWRPSGVNEQNIRAMLVNPEDYRMGQINTPTSGNQAAIAVGRYDQDHVAPLPTASEQSFSPGGAGSLSTTSGTNVGGN